MTITTSDRSRAMAGPHRGSAVANEFAKLRHLRIGPIAVALILGTVAATMLTTIASADFADPGTRDWNVPLAGLSLAMPLLSPLLIAVIASRMIDIEHQGSGWLLNQTSGLTPGALCRAKLITGTAVIGVATVTANLLVWVLGRLLGIEAPLPAWLWFGLAACSIVINTVVLATHLIVSAKVENQLVGLGLGALGTVIALFSSGLPRWFAHLTPWGHYSLITAAGYEHGELVTMIPSYPSVAVLAVVAAVTFTMIISRFDRQEA